MQTWSSTRSGARQISAEHSVPEKISITWSVSLEVISYSNTETFSSLSTHHGPKVYFLVRNEEFVSQPTVLGMAVKEAPVIDKVPVCTEYCCNGWDDPGYYSPANSLVDTVSCSQTDSYDCQEIFQSIVSLQWVFLFKEATEALEEAWQVGKHSHDEVESVEHITVFASVFSVFEVSPNIVANVELEAPKGLHL